jgi:hypothetical protein
MTGFIAVVAFTFLLISSPSAVRHAFYETFLHLHIAAAAIAVAGVWIHLKGMPQQYMMYGVVGLWAFEVIIRYPALRVPTNKMTANFPSCPPYHAEHWKRWHQG